MINRFWRPLFGGIQLDPELEVSSRRFELILAMLIEGDAVRQGHGFDPRQLAADLPPGRIHLGTTISAITGSGVQLTDTRAMAARAVVVATKRLARHACSASPIQVRVPSRPSTFRPT